VVWVVLGLLLEFEGEKGKVEMKHANNFGLKVVKLTQK
jgi:hypothetical protein